jgi:hypothetical protein
VVPYKDKLLVMQKLDPDAVAPEEGFSRDVRNIGTWRTGDPELCLRTMADFERAKPLLDRSYGEDPSSRSRFFASKVSVAHAPGNGLDPYICLPR